MTKSADLPQPPKDLGKTSKAGREIKTGLPSPVKANLPISEVEDRPLSQVERSTQQLIKVLDSTPSNPGERELELVAARADIAHTFEQFPVIIPRFAEMFRAELSAKGFDPGAISVFIGGGRLVGKPLKANSDIDLFITFEHPINPHKGDAAISGQDWIVLRRKLLHEQFVKVCEEVGIPNINGYPGRFQFMAWGERSPEQFLETQQEGEKALLLHTDRPQKIEDEAGIVVDESPFTYERVDDPEMADRIEHRRVRMKIAGKEPRAATDEEILARIKRDKEEEQWYTSERWRLKGKPAEQIDILAGDHPITIYNYNGEAPLTDAQLETMRTTLSGYLARFPQLAEKLRWICVEDVQEGSIHKDEDGYPLNGLAMTRWGLFHLTPRGMEMDRPHRIPAANNLEGTMTHELTHFIEDTFRPEWQTLNKWGYCMDDPDNWEYKERVEGGPKIWTHKSTGELAPLGKYPIDPTGFVTHYAKLNGDEDLCESMVAYVYDPEYLKATSQAKHDVIAAHDQKNEPVEIAMKRVPADQISIPQAPPTVVKYFIEEN